MRKRERERVRVIDRERVCERESSRTRRRTMRQKHRRWSYLGVGRSARLQHAQARGLEFSLPLHFRHQHLPLELGCPGTLRSVHDFRPSTCLRNLLGH